MLTFIKHFVRDPDGSWLCVAPATWVGPPRVQVTAGTRFTPGSTFMGVDVVMLLDKQAQGDQGRP